MTHNNFRKTWLKLAARLKKIELSRFTCLNLRQQMPSQICFKVYKGEVTEKSIHRADAINSLLSSTKLQHGKDDSLKIIKYSLIIGQKYFTFLPFLQNNR